ncbi:hypothetical protein GCM10008910_25060 [Faecalicatena orotica]
MTFAQNKNIIRINRQELIIKEKGDDSHGSEIERVKKKQKRFYTGRIDCSTGYPWYTDCTAGAFIDRVH